MKVNSMKELATESFLILVQVRVKLAVVGGECQFVPLPLTVAFLSGGIRHMLGQRPPLMHLTKGREHG